MGFKILDATGHGFEAKVNSANRLAVDAVTRLEIAEKSQTEGQAFQIYSNPLTITTTAGAMLYFKNASSSYKFHVNSFLLTSDGGSTNFNRPLEIKLYAGMTAPSANNEDGYAANLNFTSGSVADLTVEQWNEVGTGMTVSSNGNYAGSAMIGQGSFFYLTEGAYILGTNDTFGITARSVSDTNAEFSIVLNGYFSEV